MKIVAISDTHNKHREIKIPDADVLVHAGDITWRGELSIVQDFADWLKDIPIKHKIVIFGNHELGFQRGHKRDPAIKLIQDAGATYLEDSGIEIDGVKFWGSPWQPWFHDWEFNLQRGKDIDAKWALIPQDTNVLITHGPPYLIMDEAPRGIGAFDNVGCKDLLNRVGALENLKYHVFGHIHNGYGTKEFGPCTFINAAICTEAYAASNEPIVFEV